jgi:microcystin-dependent protein
METVGNFLTQSNKDFPLDCDTLAALQANTALVAALGNVAGDKLILAGCELTNGNTQRAAGLVFVRTQDYLQGEVLRWEGGVISGGMYVKLEDVPVDAQGYAYPKAYTRRTLAPGVGTENFSWEDFKKPKTSAELEAQIAALSDLVTNMGTTAVSEPLGIVKTWAGKQVPGNYALCDGAALRIDEYPDLYAALGTTFNTAFNHNGTRYTTQSGYFRLPDLRGRFVCGHNDVDAEYGTYGNAGGEKKHALTINEMPSHAHSFKDYYFAEAYNEGNHDVITTNGKIGGGKTDHDNTYLYYYRHDTDTKGGGVSHENRPPYYVLAYIMKVR